MDSKHIEKKIIQKIIKGQYKNFLPSERELSRTYKVTRQKIREILQRLQQDGWIEIQHGKPTKIRFIFEEGGLNILNSLIRHGIWELPSIEEETFIIQLLEVRSALAPVYTQNCLQENSKIVLDYLKYIWDEPERLKILKNSPIEITSFDWNLHRILCKHSGNPIFLFLLNSFREVYFHFGNIYFSLPEARERSIQFYENFYKKIQEKDNKSAIEEISRVTKDSIEIIKKSFKHIHSGVKK